MDYEKKYKALVEAVKTLKEANPSDEGIQNWVNDNVPELKESEDEKIRKEMIEILTKESYDFPSSVIAEKSNSWIAWLEKQGSEPNWCHHKVDLSNCSEEYRKAYYDGWNNCNMQHSQCKSESNDVVKCLINGMKFYYEDNEEATWGTEKFSMKVKDILAWLEKQGEQKPEWTTVDEQNLNVVLSHIPNECLRRWLKEAIHVRYNKPTEWGEEDEKMLNLIIAVFEVNHPNEYFKANELNDPNMRAVYTEEIVTWLKSLKDRYSWKPSDEQMGVIEAVINNRSFQKRHLDSLYEQLKKLKGE